MGDLGNIFVHYRTRCFTDENIYKALVGVWGTEYLWLCDCAYGKSKYLSGRNWLMIR